MSLPSYAFTAIGGSITMELPSTPSQEDDTTTSTTMELPSSPNEEDDTTTSTTHSEL